MKKNIMLYIFVTIFLAICCVLGVFMKVWTLVVISAFGSAFSLINIISVIKKEKHEKEMDAKHSDEFIRIRRAGQSGYEYAYTEYRKDSFEKIYDWERSELEDIIWNYYLSGIIKIAYLLPYLDKYDGKSRLQEDLASPNTPEGWKKEISFALDLAAREDM